MIDENAENLTRRYNREARDYQRLWAPVLRPAGLRLVEELSDTPAERILDVAAGVGSLLPDLRDEFPAAFIAGVDRSFGMLALASADFPRAVMDASQSAIASNSIDLVLIAFALFHLSNPMDGLLEAYRVLRSGGRIGTITWAGDLELPAQSVWNECLESHGAPPPDPNTRTGFSKVDTPEKVAALLESAGFRNVRVWLDDLVVTLDMERLFERWTRMGVWKTRFDALNEAAQTACLMEGRERLTALSSEAFQARGKVIYAIARF
jgi:trans-aconitate methyltransferase